MRALYVTHPEVAIDPTIPVPQWGLSDEGWARATAFAARALLPRGIRIVASEERKALETAMIIAAATGSEVESYPEFGENDRSSTGFLAGERFEAHVHALFSHPAESVAGWETAVAAQKRIVRAVTANLDARDVVFVGHGCVGTLLKCHLGGRPIAESEDQRVMASPGGGNCFVFEAGQLLTDWMPTENFTGF